MMQGIREIRFETVGVLLGLHTEKLQRSFLFYVWLKDYLKAEKNFRLNETVAFNEFFQVEFTITCMVESSITDVPIALLSKFNLLKKESTVALRLVKIEETLHSYKMVIRIIS